MALKLGVNIDHVATIRQARYARMPEAKHAEPCPVDAARLAIDGGADSITIHVRGDRRHMQDADAFLIRREISVPLNFEMGVTEEMIGIALKLMPAFCCLVPETREEVTTEGGLDVKSKFESTRGAVTQLQDTGIQVSLFIDPELEQVEASAASGAKMIELHTGAFANAVDGTVEHELERLVAAAEAAHKAGLQVNAGHGLNYENLQSLFVVPFLTELNIGHSIVSRSVITGLSAAVRDMKLLMAGYR